MLKVLGHRVLVEVQEIEQVSAGGIVMVTDKNIEREKQHNCLGTVVGVGSTAYKGLGDGDPWVEIGDRVYFQKYGGIIVKEDGKDLRILNDEDILAIKE